MSGRARAILISVIVLLVIGAAIVVFVILSQRGAVPTFVAEPEAPLEERVEPIPPEPTIEEVAPPVVPEPQPEEALFVPPPLPPADTTTRCTGNGPIELTINCARLMFPQSGSAQKLFLSRSDNTVDAFVATPWIGNVGGAYLAVDTSSASSQVLSEIDRLLPNKTAEIIILGGTAAVSDNVVSQLNAQGYGNVRRVFGQNRYSTATAIAEEVIKLASGPIRSFFLTEGQFLVDAYGAGPVAAGTAPSTGLRFILINPRGSSTLHPATASFLQLHPELVVSTIFGGTSAVPSQIETILRQNPYNMVVVERVADVDRYWTNFRTIARFYTQPTRVIITNGNPGQVGGDNGAYSMQVGGSIRFASW